MTFTEAAIEVLRREGKPLDFRQIAELAVRDGLLEHVGKIPEEVMGGLLAAHCRLPRAERRVIPVQAGIFALTEWGLEEDPRGLEGIAEPPSAEEPPLRPRERHPVPSREAVRHAARGEQRARRREEAGERRARRFPPPAEVAYEILAGAEGPLSLTEIAALGAERFLMPDAFVRDSGSLAAALTEDNRRRESAGRKPLFALDGETVALASQPEPGERAAPPAAPAAARPAGAAEMRRAGLSALRRRLRQCEGPAVERVAAQLLEKMGLRELKVAKRGREHVVYTGRRRMGVADVRHCVRILRSGADVGRRDVSDVRRDLGAYGAQVGMVVTAGEAARDARAEATAAGQMPVVLLAGEALSEALADAGLGCRVVAVPSVDEEFFQAAEEAGAREETARRARREERERREREARPGAAPEAEEVLADQGAPLPEAAGETPAGAETEAEEVEGGGEEGEAADRRRRRRRRRRGGRGRGRGAQGAAPEGAAGEGAAAAEEPGGEDRPAAHPEAPPAPGGAAEGSGGADPGE